MSTWIVSLLILVQMWMESFAMSKALPYLVQKICQRHASVVILLFFRLSIFMLIDYFLWFFGILLDNIGGGFLHLL